MQSTIKSAILAGAALLCAGAARAQEADFQGKTVTVVIGGESNSGFDTYGRVFARFLGAHLPGAPVVIVQNIPAAGGLIATNYLYNVAPHDGTVIGVIGQVAAIGQVLGTPGVQYDVRKLLWVGRLVSNSQVLHTWYTSGITTIDDALTHEVIVAGTGPTSSSVVFPRLMNDLLGMKFKVVRGYTGPASATLAMQAGEVEGVVRPWNDIKAKNADWLRDKKINLLVQYDLARNPEIPDVPAVVDLAHTQDQRQLLGLFASGGDVGYPVVAPPGLAPPVAAALRKAFDDVVRDPNFLAAAREGHMDLDPLPGDKLQEINDDALNVPENVVEQAKKYSSGG
jgi:tripartite-type tricarboxylate transporter receptor subunit TctC